MSAKTFTPGPWEVDRHMAGNLGQDACYAVRDVDDFIVADVWADVDHLRHNAQANAHLIAAAPELLESAKELREALAALMRVCFVSECDHSIAWGEELRRLGIPDGVGVRAQTAIAKAEGK